MPVTPLGLVPPNGPAATSYELSGFAGSSEVGPMYAQCLSVAALPYSEGGLRIRKPPYAMPWVVCRTRFPAGVLPISAYCGPVIGCVVNDTTASYESGI